MKQNPEMEVRKEKFQNWRWHCLTEKMESEHQPWARFKLGLCQQVKQRIMQVCFCFFLAFVIAKA